MRQYGILETGALAQFEREKMMILVDSFRLRWAIFLTFLLAGMMVTTGNAVELQLQSESIAAGNTATLTLDVLQGDDEPTTLVIDLVFDTAFLSLTNVAGISGTGGATVDFQATATGASLVFFGGTIPFTDAPLATLDFAVAATAVAGDTLSIANGASSGANANAEALVVSLQSAIITVSLPFTAHRADTNQDGQIAVGEVLRLVQLYNSGTYSCDADSEDGYRSAPGSQDCSPHDSDYAPQDWQIDLSELLRTVQFYNSEGYHYHPDETSEDGFAPGPAPENGTR